MAAGAWKFFTTLKSRAMNGTVDVEAKQIKLLVLDNTAAPTAGLLSTATAAIANNLASNFAGGTNTDTYATSETLLTATGQNYRFDISATSVFTATTGDATVGYLVLAEATDGQLLAWCDINTATTAGTSITAGNTLTVSYPTSGVWLVSGAAT